MSRRAVVAWALAGLLAGCGYSVRGNLPARLRTIYIQPVTNRIDITSEDGMYSRYKVYRPLLELDLTNAIVSRFQFDGNVLPVRREHADLMLVGELIGFRRDPLRFAQSGDADELRLSIVMRVEVRDLDRGTILWRDDAVVGDTTFFERGSRAEAEATALDRAVVDVARRIVERTVEGW